MYIGNTRNRPSLMLNDVTLAVVDEVRDLGVIIDSRRSLTHIFTRLLCEHLLELTLSALCLVTCLLLSAPIMVYDRPIVEYASCVWSANHVSKTKQIESVQKRFTKRLPGCALLNCEARLSRLGLESLEMRRLKYDLLYTYEIIFGPVSDAAMKMLTLTYTLYSTSTRGHAYKLYPHNNRIDSSKHFFLKELLYRGTIYRLQPIISALSHRLSDF